MRDGELSMPVVVRVRGLTRQIGARVVLDHIDLTLRIGERVALLGPRGSGKSALLRALARRDANAEGSGSLQVPENRAVMFRDARLLPWASVLDNVALGIAGESEVRARGLSALEEVGLAGHARAYPAALSSEAQQRVALARALVSDPTLLLADEPFGDLDALTRMRMHELLRALCTRHGLAVLLITHDVDAALALADRVLVLDQGRLVRDLPLALDTPRTRDPRMLRYRNELLAALGIAHPEPALDLRSARGI